MEPSGSEIWELLWVNIGFAVLTVVPTVSLPALSLVAVIRARAARQRGDGRFPLRDMYVRVTGVTASAALALALVGYGLVVANGRWVGIGPRLLMASWVPGSLPLFWYATEYLRQVSLVLKFLRDMRSMPRWHVYAARTLCIGFICFVTYLIVMMP